jgi:hypothetical protein
MKKILIRGGDITSGKLDLSDRDANAGKGEKIKWQIVDDTVVKSIVAIPIKAGSKDIFVGRRGERPNRDDDKNWKADIAEDVSIGDICEYSIVWKDGNDNEHTDDPKISINASVGYLTWVIIFSLAFLGLSLIYWRMKRMKNRNT